MVQKEEKFSCKRCGEITKKTDYDYKDANLYYSLARESLCEKCARGMRNEANSDE